MIDDLDINLTDEEKALFRKIDLRPSHENHDEHFAALIANKEPILALLQSLCERRAIPRERWKYWDNPDYNTGMTNASHKKVFERNGTVGEDIYTHPHFIRYLRYFLFGPDLSVYIVESFKNQVGNPDWVTSGDIVPIGECARSLTRKHNLNRKDAAEEFFKLSLEIGLGLETAKFVRQSVMKLR